MRIEGVLTLERIRRWAERWAKHASATVVGQSGTQV